MVKRGEKLFLTKLVIFFVEFAPLKFLNLNRAIFPPRMKLLNYKKIGQFDEIAKKIKIGLKLSIQIIVFSKKSQNCSKC